MREIFCIWCGAHADERVKAKQDEKYNGNFEERTNIFLVIAARREKMCEKLSVMKSYSWNGEKYLK